MRAQVGPASSEIFTLSELEKFLTDRDTGIFGYFKGPNTALAKMFLEYADRNREKYRFGHTFESVVFESDGEK